MKENWRNKIGIYTQEAEKGKKFVLTEKGYLNTPDCIKHEREIGKPVKGFEERVTVSWIKKGYVEEI